MFDAHLWKLSHNCEVIDSFVDFFLLKVLFGFVDIILLGNLTSSLFVIDENRFHGFEIWSVDVDLLHLIFFPFF